MSAAVDKIKEKRKPEDFIGHRKRKRVGLIAQSPLRQFEYRGVEQLVARRAHNPEVVGSSPASATIKTPDFIAKSGVFLTFCGELNLSNFV